MRTLLTPPSAAIRDLSNQGTSQFAERTGLFENWQTALGLSLDSMTSVSDSITLFGPRREREKKIDEYVRDGLIDAESVPPKRSTSFAGYEVDYDTLAKMAKEKGLDAQTDEDMIESVRSDLKMREQYAADVFSRRTGMGTAGMFAGMFHAAAIDPLNLPSYLVGIGAVNRSASILRQVARAAAVGASIEAGTAAAIEPFIHKWKAQMEMDYSFTDSLKNIAFAAGMGGAIPGGAVGLGALARKLGKMNQHPAVIKAAETDVAVAEARRMITHIVREADEGVKLLTYTPRGETLHPSLVALEKGNLEAAARYRAARLEAEKAGLLDEFLAMNKDKEPSSGVSWDEIRGKEAALAAQKAGLADEFYAGIEGEIKAQDTAGPMRGRDTNPTTPDMIEDGPLSESFATAVADAPDVPVMTMKTVDGETVAVRAESAAAVVDEFDKNIADIQKFINCMSGVVV